MRAKYFFNEKRSEPNEMKWNIQETVCNHLSLTGLRSKQKAYGARTSKWSHFFLCNSVGIYFIFFLRFVWFYFILRFLFFWSRFVDTNTFFHSYFQLIRFYLFDTRRQREKERESVHTREICASFSIRIISPSFSFKFNYKIFALKNENKTRQHE